MTIMIAGRTAVAMLSPRSTARAGCVQCWTGESVASVEFEGIPLATLYSAYSDVARMPEWSGLLESVTVDSTNPTHSLWVMKVPRALVTITRALGYTAASSSSAGADKIAWEAVLEAPGPPSMSWTSLMRDAGGVQNAGFVPEGFVLFEQKGPKRCAMTLTLRYELPEPAARWKTTLVTLPFVQAIVKGRMVAGMERFARVVREERSAVSGGGDAATEGAAAAQGTAAD